MSLTCPNCQKELLSKLINGVQIDYCENGCKGVWFDDGELKKIKEQHTDDVVLSKIKGPCQIKTKEIQLNEKVKICPRCKIELTRYNWDICSNIYLDTCTECSGVWVDYGELSCMEKYIREYSTNKIVNKEELEQKLQEIKETTIKKMEQDKDDTVNKIIDWDIWVFDDLLKFLVKSVT